MQQIKDNIVNIDPFFGVLAVPYKWVPSLRFLHRRNRVLQLFKNLSSGSVLEVGCGAGTILLELALLNFQCYGLEPSISARALAQKIFRARGVSVPIYTTAPADWRESFDTICAFDVLEHINDDEEALNGWTSWLKPGGRLVLSVPAHTKRWSYGDVWAGHYRRYNGPELKQLISNHGLHIEHFECYGFPIANLTEWFGNRSYRNILDDRTCPQRKEEASAESGIQREVYLKIFPLLNNPLGRFVLRISFAIQTLFMRTNFGSGYIVVATKK